jgi:RHS repeat-associated protein
LTNVRLPSGVPNTFTFNADGKRVQKQDSAGTTKPVWDGENIVVETDQNDATQVVYTLEPAQYGNLVSQLRGSATTYAHFDGLGSTDRLTDAAANVTDSYTYFAFGAIKASTGSTTNPFRYVGGSGYYYDTDAVEYYIRARQYDPARARFLARDSLGFENRQINLYHYANNSPMNLTDPSGSLPVPPSFVGLPLYRVECWGARPTPFFCGSYRQYFWFYISPPPRQGGYDVQEVVIVPNVIDCKTKVKLNYPTQRFWEAEKIPPAKPGQLMLIKDKSQYPRFPRCTKGDVYVAGTTKFYVGRSEEYMMSKGFLKDNPDCAAISQTSTFCTLKDPGLGSADSNAVMRITQSFYDCCDGDHLSNPIKSACYSLA